LDILLTTPYFIASISSQNLLSARSLYVGVHIDGYVGDSACTVDLGDNKELVKASEEALKNAIDVIHTGIEIGKIGRVIQETIQSYGFSPIKNLSGHSVGRFSVHGKPTIPNFDTGDTTQLTEGQVLAIEPFATDGEGAIYESGNPEIFMLTGKKPVRNIFTRQILKEIEKYQGLPFTTRWLTRKFSLPKVRYALRELSNLEILHDFPPLPDKKKGLVSQAEHTIIVGKKAEVITL
jgi:methionyl aminopeptidase